MSLRWKVVIIYVLPLVFLVGAFGIFSRLFLLDSFRQIEENDLSRDVEVFYNFILSEVNQLSRVGGDWAPWDDSYAYMAGEYPEYWDVNISTEVMANLRLSGIVFLTLDGEIEGAMGYDLVADEEIELPGEILQVIQQPFFLEIESADQPKSGIVVVTGQAYVVSAHAVTSSDYSAEPNGILTLLRRLDEYEVALMAESLRLPLFVEAIDRSGANLGATGRLAYERLQASGPGAVEVLLGENGLLLGYTLVNDAEGRPALLLRIERDREIFRQGNLSVVYFMAAFVVAGLLLGGLTLTLLNRSLLNPLLRLNTTVTQIGRSGNLSLRSDLNTPDEIGSLAQEMNRTLEALQKSETRLIENQQRLEWVTENMVDVVSQLDKDWNIVYVSPSVRPLLGYNPESMTGFSVLSMVHKDDREGLFRTLTRAVEDHAPRVRSEYRFPDAAGNYRWIESQGRILYDVDGRHIGAIIGARDITERIKADEKLHLNDFSLQNATEGILWIDQTSVIFYANQGVERMLGYAPGEMLDKTISQFDLDLPQTGWSGFLAQVRGQTTLTRQARFRSKTSSVLIETTCCFTTFAGRAFVVVFLRRVIG